MKKEALHREKLLSAPPDLPKIIKPPFPMKGRLGLIVASNNGVLRSCEPGSAAVVLIRNKSKCHATI